MAYCIGNSDEVKAANSMTLRTLRPNIPRAQ